MDTDYATKRKAQLEVVVNTILDEKLPRSVRQNALAVYSKMLIEDIRKAMYEVVPD